MHSLSLFELSVSPLLHPILVCYLVCTGYLLGAGDMARSEARILLIGSDLGQGLSSVAVCRCTCRLCLARTIWCAWSMDLRVYSCLRMLNQHDPTRHDYTDA